MSHKASNKSALGHKRNLRTQKWLHEVGQGPKASWSTHEWLNRVDLGLKISLKTHDSHKEAEILP